MRENVIHHHTHTRPALKRNVPLQVLRTLCSTSIGLLLMSRSAEPYTRPLPAQDSEHFHCCLAMLSRPSAMRVPYTFFIVQPTMMPVNGGRDSEDAHPHTSSDSHHSEASSNAPNLLCTYNPCTSQHSDHPCKDLVRTNARTTSCSASSRVYLCSSTGHTQRKPTPPFGVTEI